jgi:hypothetical protein
MAVFAWGQATGRSRLQRQENFGGNQNPDCVGDYIVCIKT